MTAALPFPISLSQPFTAWTPAQWVAAWQSKADASNPALAGTFTGMTANTVLLGTGPINQAAGVPYQFQAAIAYDPSVAQVGFTTSVYRQNMVNTTLTYATADTTNIWENFCSFVIVNGPHAAQGEINCLHGYLQINSGIVATAGECVEASMLNNGSISAFSGMLSIAHNGAAGTSASMTGYNTGLTNDNTTAGAVNTWVGFHMAARLGAGAVPTNYFAFRNDDSAATVMTLGGVVIGTTAQQVSPGSVFIQGSDNSGGTFSLTVKTLSGTNALLVNNAGDVTVNDGSANGNWGAATLATTTAYTVSTLPSATGRRGYRAYVTDATAPTFLGALTGGGAVVCPVFCNGTAWVAG